MAYIGKVPSAVPITSADLADSIVTSAKIADGTIALADLSATGTASASTFLRGDNAWGAVSSDVVKLATVTNTTSFADVSIDGYFSATYDYYELVVLDFYSSSSGNCFVHFNIGGTKSTSSVYDSACMGIYGSSSTTATTNNYTYINATGVPSRNDISGNSDFPKVNDFVLRIYNPLSTSAYKAFDWSLITNTGSLVGLHTVRGIYKNTSAVSGVTVSGNGGVKGTFKLYGYK
jgi:hypothetical protein